jgi:hypothetical protein
MIALRSATFVSSLLLLTGCNGIFWGNVGVLAVTAGIFFGTIFLSKTRSAPRPGSVPTPTDATKKA